jgi:hypothetical protein
VLAIEGIPPIVQPLNVRPVGNEPLVRAHVTVPLPPLVVRTCEYETLTSPVGRLVVVTLGATLMVRETDTIAVP